MAFGRGNGGGEAPPPAAPMALKLDDMWEMSALIGQKCGVILNSLNVAHPVMLDLDAMDMHLSRLRELHTGLKSIVIPLRAELERRQAVEADRQAKLPKPN